MLSELLSHTTIRWSEFGGCFPDLLFEFRKVLEACAESPIRIVSSKLRKEISQTFGCDTSALNYAVAYVEFQDPSEVGLAAVEFDEQFLNRTRILSVIPWSLVNLLWRMDSQASRGRVDGRRSFGRHQNHLRKYLQQRSQTTFKRESSPGGKGRFETEKKIFTHLEHQVRVE